MSRNIFYICDFHYAYRGGQCDLCHGKCDKCKICENEYNRHNEIYDLSKEFTKKVFNSFERERSVVEGGIPGTGLGTAITKRIVDLMGGSINVESEKGKGTEFIIHLSFPLVDDAENVTDQTLESSQSNKTVYKR